MARSITKQESEKAPHVQQKASPSSGKVKDTPSKTVVGASKSSVKEKTEATSTGSTSGPASNANRFASQSKVDNHQDLPLRQLTDLNRLRRGKSGPHSVSSAESGAERSKVNREFSVNSSWSTDMSEAPESGVVSATQSSGQGPSKVPTMDLHLHPYEDFLPGKIVKLECFDEEPLVWDGEGERPTRDQFLARDRARRRKIGRFAIFRTHLDYSMAIPIHTYDPQDPRESTRKPEHQAIIYTDARKPPLPLDGNSPKNPAIQVKRDVTEELPQGSRLDYSDTFVVEHNRRVAFIGQVTKTDFPNFAKTYQEVQLLLGRDVPRPQSRAKSAAPTSSSDDGHSVSEEHTPSISRAQLSQLQPADSAAPPLYHGPSSPESCTSEMTSSSTAGRTSAEQIALHDAGWLGGFTSEAPLDQLRLSGETRTETMQDKFSPLYAGYTSNVYEVMRAGDIDMRTPQGIECYGEEYDDPIGESEKWINRAIQRQRDMMRLLLQQGQSVEEFCNYYRRQGGSFAASRVKVAILDTEVDTNSAVFDCYKRRIKGYMDFRPDKSQPKLDSHGTHVTSLFLRMAPETDVYIAKAFDTWESLTAAINYAIDVWQVDIISISGGGRVELDVQLEQALRYAHYFQIHVFAATHNKGFNEDITAPARVETVYPVFSTNSSGKLSRTAADPTGLQSYGALGEYIETFWMEKIGRKDPKTKRWPVIKGSSFATPIVAGIFASTILFTRLALQASRTSPTPSAGQVSSTRLAKAIMEVVSVNCGTYRYVRPSDMRFPPDESWVVGIQKLVHSAIAGTGGTQGRPA